MVETKFGGIDSSLSIDKFNLDEECIKQPQLFLEAADLAVVSAEERDNARLEMDKMEAFVEEEIRKLVASGGAKMTEGAIASAIERDPKYIAAQENYIRKKAEASFAEATKQAFEQRKSMLELVCKLYLSEYFSDVSVKKGAEVSSEIGLETIKKEIAKGGAAKALSGRRKFE